MWGMKRLKFHFEKPTERGFLGDVAFDGKVILKCYEYTQDFNRLRTVSVVGTYGQSNELLNSRQRDEFLDE
jgi:hypothetical protein